ncbi:MAG: polyphosphate kinase 1 [Cyclobacteriaceae bacterium]|nr:polyphosphate kinase 1 [Cyclobacteriaceae bacterium]
MALKNTELIDKSKYISRDLSWLQFNDRVLDQARREHRTIYERLKFIAISESNLDEFFMIRVGSLYSYLDYKKQRRDYSGLREIPFKKLLFKTYKKLREEQSRVYCNLLKPLFKPNGFEIVMYKDLSEKDKSKADKYFCSTIFPMLTPMVYDSYHTFPTLANLRLVLGVVTKFEGDQADNKKLSFVQIPINIPRFFEIVRKDSIHFVPIEDIVSSNISALFRNVEILSKTLFRITRNGDFTLEESEDIESNFLEELRQKLRTRKSGRVVRLEYKGDADKWMLNQLMERWKIEDINISKVGEDDLIDYTGLKQVAEHTQWKDKLPEIPAPVKPLNFPEQGSRSIFEILKERDILLHHPYNTIEPVIELLEKSAVDPNTLAIKITIYRLANNSRISAALLKAAENGKHVSVLFEVKARFDEERNLEEAQKLQKAGCFVIYGVSNLKTHTKLLLIVRKEGKSVTRYVHLASGNYNEITSKLYTDIGLLTTDEVIAEDTNEFFNVITGHSFPTSYKNLLTAPREMRTKLIAMIENEAANALKGLPAGIVVKINSLQDKEVIDSLYAASKAGVPIKLIVRGICCLKPGKPGLSENIEVKSIVGDYLEHSRIYYFHNNNAPILYVGSADIMVRSFDRRMESLFRIDSPILKQQLINNLHWNLKDTVNSYILKDSGEYLPLYDSEERFNIHKAFYTVNKSIIKGITLFPEKKEEKEIIISEN